MRFQSVVDARPVEAARLSTDDVPARERPSWLREVIGREYTSIEITPPRHARLFNEMTIYPWDALRLSIIRSGPLTLERLRQAGVARHQDAYFAVVLLSGKYRLQQGAQEVELQPGDMALYDATRPHRIDCATGFSKIILSVPRSELRERMPAVSHCVARRIAGGQGMGAVAIRHLCTVAEQFSSLRWQERLPLSAQSLDLLALAIRSVCPERLSLSSSQAASLYLVKDIVERMLATPNLTAVAIGQAAGLSTRYINQLFKSEHMSLMRYVWFRRLQRCRRDLENPGERRTITEIAFRWGFNDLSHFSRLFKLTFGCPPRDVRGR